MREAKDLLKIIKNFLDEKECEVNKVENEIQLYKLARKHNVSGFLYNWSINKSESEKVKNAIKKDYTAQIVKDTNQNIELEKMLDIFEKNNIEVLVVKGCVIKDIYPQNYMREMCDIDIMIHDKDLKKALELMKDYGYGKYYDHEKHVILTKPPFMIVEVHRKLILDREIGYEYFKNIWPSCINYKNYKKVYQLSVDDAYIFCILHLLEHFKFMGIKIKDILDVYLYNEKYKDILDYNKINKKFKELNIDKFEEKIKNIAYKWFDENENMEFDEIEQFILKGISQKNRVNYLVGEENGKTKSLLRLIFPEFTVMKEKYPILEKAAFLLPATWIVRIFKDIFINKIPFKERVNTVKLIQETDNDEVKKIKKIYTRLGI